MKLDDKIFKTSIFLMSFFIGFFSYQPKSIAYPKEISKKVYTPDEWCDAIYLAEGGTKSDYPYGIRSVKCEGEQDCREVCIRTVSNNFRRYDEYGYKTGLDFAEFFGERFCPTRGKNLTAREREVNKYWLKNVKWFLNNPKRGEK